MFSGLRIQVPRIQGADLRKPRNSSGTRGEENGRRFTVMPSLRNTSSNALIILASPIPGLPGFRLGLFSFFRLLEAAGDAEQLRSLALEDPGAPAQGYGSSL